MNALIVLTTWGPIARALPLARQRAWRRGDGAFAYGLYEDAADPGRWLEWFLVESWAEHLRQHARVTRADADVEAEAKTFHLGPEPPVVAHHLAPGPATRKED
jgi:hypothetical protein